MCLSVFDSLLIWELLCFVFLLDSQCAADKLCSLTPRAQRLNVVGKEAHMCRSLFLKSNYLPVPDIEY